MNSGQQLLDSLGNQVALFPLDRLQITQGEYGSFSHQGSLAIDFIGSTTLYPYYAPFDCKLIRTTPSGYIYQSVNKVRSVLGVLDYFCLWVVHDDNATYTVGRVVQQGQLLGRTGTRGYVTGDHVHLEVSQGVYGGIYENSSGTWVLRNQISMVSLFDIRDTTIINDYNYPWTTYSGGLEPPTPIPSNTETQELIHQLVYSLPFMI